MKGVTTIGLGVAIVSGMAAGVARSQQPPAQPAAAVDHSTECPSACLKDMLDRYLAAFLKHDPSSLPVAPSIKAAENSHQIALGENAWRTVLKLRPDRMVFTDPFAGQAVAIGTLEMGGGEPFIYALRLAIDRGRIAESEMMVTAASIAGRHFKPDTIASFEPLLTQTLPAAARPTREQLLEQSREFWNEKDGFRSAPDCIHTENGEPAPGNRFGCPAAQQPGGESLFTGRRDIRHVLEDTEHGVAITYVNQDATPRPRPVQADERTPLLSQRPVTVYSLDLLKLVDGQVKREALFTNIQEANAPLPFVN